MGKVLFTSSRPLYRAENVRAVWDKCPFDKEFARIDPCGNCPAAADAWRNGFSVIVTDEFLKYVDRKDRVSVVMIEHGLSGMKLYGLDQAVRYYTPEQAALIDYWVTPSEPTRGFNASAAGIPVERCLPLGMPRTDLYVGKVKGDGGTLMASYARAYLFAPTFRAGWEPPAPVIGWGAVDQQLGDDEVLVVKRHMMARDSIAGEGFEHIVEIPPTEPSAPYLIDCDVVITDYSSIILDGYVLGKPGVCFCPDEKEYCAKRGFYRRFPEGYTRFAVYDQELLVEKAREAIEMGEAAVAQYREFFAGCCDGLSSVRVVDLVRSLL